MYKKFVFFIVNGVLLFNFFIHANTSAFYRRSSGYARFGCTVLFIDCNNNNSNNDEQIVPMELTIKRTDSRFPGSSATSELSVYAYSTEFSTY